MAWNDWVVRHAKAFVVLWILVVILATPLAYKLNDVTNYSMDQFLPKDVESVKTMDTLEDDFQSFTASENQTYMIIHGVNVNDPRTREAYEWFKAEAKPYGDNFTSYYDALDLLQNESYNITLNITKVAANLSKVLYDSAVNGSETYRLALIGVENLSNQVKRLNETLPELASAYLQLKTNLTLLYNQTLGLREALNETDAAYVQLHKNLTGASLQLKQLNSTIALLNVKLYNLSDSYASAYLGTMGVYGALATKTNAYQTGSLDPQTAEAIASQLGVPVEFVYAVFNATYPVYHAYGPRAVTDGFLANVTGEIVSRTLTDPLEKDLVSAYSYAFYLGVLAFDRAHGSDYALLESGENARKAVVEIAENSLQNTPEVIRDTGETYAIPGFGEVPAEVLANVVNVAVRLGRKPMPGAVEEATVEVAKVILAGNPVLSLPNADYVLKTLLVSGPTKELEESLLTGALAQKLSENQRDMAGLIVKTVLASDPNSEGVLFRDPDALEKAVISLLSEVLKSRGIKLPNEVLVKVYDSNGNVEPIAQKILVEETARQVKDEKAAEIIVTVAIEHADELSNGKNVPEAVKEVVMKLAGDLPVDVGMVIDEVYSGKSAEEIALELYTEGVNEKLDEVDAPKEVKDALRDVLLAVAKNYPMSETEIEELTKKKMAELVDEFVGKVGDGLGIRIDSAKLAEIAFEFRNDPDELSREDVAPVEKDVYNVLYEKAKLYIGMLKSDDNRTMLVIFVPKALKGVSDLEKQSKFQYENSIKAKEVVLKEFGKLSPSVEVYVTGTPVQTYEMIKYGKEDNDKTTKFSIIGAFIVLFVIMGVAFLATLLPFTGVATATLTALGILYLLAKVDVLDVGSWAQMLTVTTALGLGIDYSTYYLHRFREYLAEGYDHNKAASEALKRAKDAVLASASTDIIAFASFVLAYEFPIFKTMGIIAPLAVIVVLLASLTFIPAITVLIGDRPAFWWPRHIKHHIESIDLHERSRIAEWAVKHAKVVTIIALLIAVPAVYNFANFNGTHDIKLFIPKDSETYHFLQLSEDTVGAGVTSPTYIVIDLGHNVSDSDLPRINALVDRISKVSGVRYVFTVTQPFGERVDNATLDELTKFEGDRYLSKDRHKVLIQVTGEYGATDERSKDMVREIRSIVKDEKNSGKIKDGMVGGNTALALDLSNLINDVFWHRIFPVALLLMFLSLIPTLKGLPAVITTMGTIAVGVLLSITVSSWLFERVFGQQVMWFLPMLVFIVLMGVGIDYNSFYLVKARDEFERRKPEEALIVAAGTMDTLVVGLAAVLAATYGSLMTGATWGIREIGFALALGVLLTATAAVYFIGPATMALFGEKAWWPLFKNHNGSETAGKKRG
ncbi:MMPL family transporter [Thermococcus stetteri]|uniref:MMPL family transporter n=1 Tax=Thermococcus stetteri TaxID=49900 RepID=UPI001AE271EE|nr:MMPL family transporter [Thermococcus stetteri]MBP1912892.1 putative membrane protein YdfJ with MMPL/SSD domain [Thermococcus stetteri]